MFVPEQLVVSLSEKYANSSIGIIDFGLKRIFKVYLLEEDYDKNKLVENLENIVIKIREESKTSSQKRLLNSLIQVLAHEGEEDRSNELMDQFYEISKLHQDTYIYRDPDPKRYTPLEKINFAFVHCLSRRKRLLLGLYAYLPALRGQDYNDISLVRLSPDSDLPKKFIELGNNFLDLESLSMVLGKYKTVKSYGLRIIKLPDMMRVILGDYLGGRESGFLFSDKGGEHYSGNTFSCVIRDTFEKEVGIKLGVDDLRKIYISEVLGYINRKSFNISEQKYIRTKISQIQGHCLNTQEFLYSGHKFNQELPRSSDEYMKLILGIVDEMDVSFHKIE